MSQIWLVHNSSQKFCKIANIIQNNNVKSDSMDTFTSLFNMRIPEAMGFG